MVSHGAGTATAFWSGSKTDWRKPVRFVPSRSEPIGSTHFHHRVVSANMYWVLTLLQSQCLAVCLHDAESSQVQS